MSDLGNNFNPRAPHGARPFRGVVLARHVIFQSTRSAWSATAFLNHLPVLIDISIHALRMERDVFTEGTDIPRVISIHALRMERDAVSVEQARQIAISIHALRMERDILYCLSYFPFCGFQSTRSAWSATVKGDKLHKKLCCFLRQQKHKFAKEIVLIV